MWIAAAEFFIHDALVAHYTQLSCLLAHFHVMSENLRVSAPHEIFTFTFNQTTFCYAEIFPD